MTSPHPLQDIADRASHALAQADFHAAATLFASLIPELDRGHQPVPASLLLGQACALAATGALQASTAAIRRVPPASRQALLADPRLDPAIAGLLAVGWDAHQVQALLCAFAVRQGRWAYLPPFQAALETVSAQRAGVPLQRSLVFDAFSFGLPDAVIARLTRRFALDHRPAPQSTPPLAPAPTPPPGGGPLRVAILSGELRRHPTCFLHLDLVAALDRRRLHVTAVHLGPAEDAYTARMRHATDDWLWLPGESADAVAQRLREQRFDVLWAMGSFQQTPVAEVLARRPAPLVVNGLASYYPHGPELVDYSVVDAVSVPAEVRGHWGEALIDWPTSPYVMGDLLQRAAPRASRASQGLPEDGIVLAALHQGHKLTTQCADLWCAILHRCPQAVLWRLALPDRLEAAWRQALAERGIDSRAREVVAAPAGWSEHLARLACADLFLNSWPVGGHTTLLEALSQGVPGINLWGPGPAARIGHALLQAVGLDEACAGSAQEYVDRVVAWSQDAALRARWAQRLQAARPGGERPGALFDPSRQARWWEQALTTMVERHRAGLPPANFSVA